MNVKAISKIGCKLIALFFFVKYIGLLVSSVMNTLYMMSHIEGFDILGYLSYFSIALSMMILSILIWVFADKLAASIAKGEPSNVESSNIDYNQLQQIALLVAGVIIVLTSIPELISLLYQNNFLAGNSLLSNDRKQYMLNIGSTIETIGVVILGLWLALGSKGIVQGLKWLRTAGVKETQKLD